MPQNAVHAIVGVAARKWMPKKEWLLLGVVLGNMAPDLDNLVVAYATLAKLADPEIYHRTFTHSVFTILAMLIIFYLVAALTKNGKWKNFGIGFGVGILMHILLDLVLWFNGVQLFWPLSAYELNFWSGFSVPASLKILLDTGEFLAFGFYFLLLLALSRKHGTDANRQGSAKVWATIQFILFALFTILFFAIGTQGLHYTIFGAVYLVSMIVAMVVTAKMKQTVESV